MVLSRSGSFAFGGPYPLSVLNLASGIVVGFDEQVCPLSTEGTLDPAGALASMIIEYLQRPPCVVSFSGGRDSSAVLAMAADLARKHGLALPIPATNRFPGVVEADESEWQELVVRELGLSDWARFDHHDELDLIGPIAQRVLKDHGTIYPANGHFHVPLLGLARGGSLLTGIGGDEVFGVAVQDRAARVLTARVRPRRSDGRALAAALAPRWLKVEVERRRCVSPPWLTEGAAEQLGRDIAAYRASYPLWWGRSVTEFWWRSRSRVAGEQTMQLLADDHGVMVGHPLTSEVFLGAMARQHPRTGFSSRSDAMEALFGHLLPDSLLRRPTKASFFRPFFGSYSREFVRDWSGEGVDTDYIDIDALRLCWSQDQVDARSYALLQSAWLNG